MAEDKSNAQVFVRNLPRDFLEPDLETLFGEYGPIKRIDLIKDITEDGIKTSKGFGFVKFALEGDAARAVAAVNGKKILGKVVSAEIALKKGVGKPSGVPEKRTVPAKGPAVPKPVSAIETKPKRQEKQKVEVEEEEKIVHPKHEGLKVHKIPVEKPKKSAAVVAKVVDEDSESDEEEEKKAGKEAKTEKKEVAPVARLPSHPNLRTAMIYGVADDLGKNKMRVRARKVVEIENFELTPHGGGPALPSGGTAKVLCVSREGPAKLISKLDGHTVHGCTIHVRRFLEITPAGDVRAAKRHRLIVRNLPWVAEERDLVAAFGKYGPLAEVHIPRVAVTFERRNRETGVMENVSKNKARGFGFVQYLCHKDAARVAKDFATMQICGRDASVSFAVAKKQFEDQGGDTQEHSFVTDTSTTHATNDNNSGTHSNTESESEGESDEDSDTDVKKIVEKHIEKKEALAAKSKKNIEKMNSNGSDSEGESGSDMEGEGSGSGSDDEHDGKGEQEEEDEDGDDGTVEEEKPVTQRPPQQRRLPDVEQGKTVFIRNLPYDATKDMLEETFAEHGGGPVRNALLVLDHGTGLPKGTAFVKFQDKDSADRCLAAAAGPMGDPEEGGNAIYLGGRSLHVVRAVDRNEADRLKEAAIGRNPNKDKRNLYLANEGLLIETEEAAKATPASDMKKRAAARADKKQKLRNPLFFISPLRLSVRNLALGVSDHALKKLFIDAAAAGVEKGKVTVKDVRRQLEAACENPYDIKPATLVIPPVGQASVTKARVIRDLEKKPAEGSTEHPSKGYGFVEFRSHAHALAALRILNNNPAYSNVAKGSKLEKGEKARLIVEFAVENHVKTQLQDSRREKQETRKRNLAALGLKQDGAPLNNPGAGASEGAKKLSRGQRQREKKRLQREQAEANPNSNPNEPSGITAGVQEPKSKKAKREKDAESGDKGVKKGKKRPKLEENERVHEPEAALLGGEGDGLMLKKRKRKINQFDKLDKEDKRGLKIEEQYQAKFRSGSEKERGGSASAAKDSEGEHSSHKKVPGVKSARWFQ